MKAAQFATILIFIGIASFTMPAQAAPPPTGFTYQATLADNGLPAEGLTAMQFNLWDSVSDGSQVGSTISTNVDVNNGVFSADLDFGAASFAINQALWLEVIVDGQSMGRTPLGASPLALNVRGLHIAENGFVGIGTDTPTQMLEVAHRIKTTNLITDGVTAIAVRYNRSESSDYEIRAALQGLEFINKSTNELALFMDKNTSFIGIGRSSPTQMLDVNGRIRATNLIADGLTAKAVRFFSGGGDIEIGANSNGMYFLNQSSGQTAMNIDQATNFVGIGRTNPETSLDVDGAITIRGGADIVEGFDSACGTTIESGTLMVIDPNNPGMLMCSTEAYDSKVAGVVSGAGGVMPGLKLGQEGVMDGEILVTMTGRAYILATNENGSIEPGDLLTTSTTLGHAMKATDRNRSNGAVIGKAMSRLDKDSGLVLVLVNLQ
ncbi:hypothetical protein COB72_00495 [bacterium]|nr:MAG: hypothetical protein COB72_00495 [bacterium]